MRHDPRAFLWDVLKAADNIEAFVRDRTPEEFARDAMLHSAVERQLEIIGEALSQLAKVAPQLAGEIPDHRQVVGLRNILIHGYAVVNRELIWRAVHENLPGLRAAVDRLIRASGPPSE